MTGDAKAPLFSDRERRILLWVCCAAVCWRWLLAVRTPMPCVDAVTEMWVGEQLAAGHFAALREVWAGPWWSVMIGVAVAFGCDSFVVAQVLGCVFSGLALVPLSCFAQRCKRGAGVPVALLLLVLPWEATAAAGGSAVGLHLLWLGFALWLAVGRLRGLAVLVGVIGLMDTAAAAYVVLPMIAGVVVAGLVLARLPLRGRDLALTAIAPVGLYLAWHAVEPRQALLEREIGEILGEQLSRPGAMYTCFPRIGYYAGNGPSPDRGGAFDLLVLREQEVDDWAGVIAGDFDRFDLPVYLEDAGRARGIVLFVRRE